MTDRLGQQLGNYQLLRLLGEGGFAEVYLGEHIHLGTQAAIKVLHTQLTSDDVDRFRAEARTIAHLIHPHIVRVLEFGVEGKTPFLVMDYAPNGTLRQRHPKGTPLPLDTILLYVKQIADALQYAHDEKVIHRDIKPENMLLGRRNEILLSDFGIALVAQSSRYQSAQEMAGTMAYMAPEQIQGKPRPASDQYSLGIVVYEWLSGDRPFHGSLTELVGQHLSVPPPSLLERVSTISPEVDRVVLTALEKDPHRRFANVQTYATALEQACQPAHQVTPPTEVPPLSELSLLNDRIAARSPSQPPLPTHVITPSGQSSLPTEIVTPPSQSFQLPVETITPSPAVLPLSMRETIPSDRPQELQPTQRRISRRTVVAGLAGLVVAGGGLTWLALSQRPQVPSFSASSRTVPTPTSTPSPTPSPTSSGPPLGTTFLTYRGHSAQVLAVAWSPDGKRIASTSVDATVQVWDAITGKNVLVYHGHLGEVLAVAWSPDGKRIVSGGGDHTVQVWDAASGGNVLTYRGHSDALFDVAWSPDGKRIASGSVDHTVQVWDAASGGNVLTYRGHSDVVWTVKWSPDGKRIASGSGSYKETDHTVQVWDAASGGNVLTYQGHSAMVFAVAWSPSGKYIASGSDDKTVQVWDAVSGGNVLTYQGHSSMVFAVAWSPSGKHIASAGSYPDHTVQVWDAEMGTTLFTYQGHSDQVFKVAWSLDSKRIASGSVDHTVQVWQAS